MTAPAAHIPVIETARLTLRGHVMSDFGPFAAFYASDRSRYMGGPMDRIEAWHQFGADVAHWDLLGHGPLAITDREDGAFLGQVSILQPPHFPEREIGWFVLPEAEGRGVAREAATALRGWSYATVSTDPLVSYINRDNVASIRLAERLGAVLDDDAIPPFEVDGVWRHPAPERLQ